MNLSFLQTGSTGVLTISGDMGIEFASALKPALADALEAVTSLELDLAGVTTASLCCLQLFCSAHKTSMQSGKRLTANDVSEGFAASVDEAGFVRHVGCANCGDDECLWLECGNGQ
jgi:anti-anti-sigma regulatory factor